tara:strand:- start:2310 stop:2648 length:339 start_codon:yes stop_codon:yes gene_type:complete
MGKKKRILFNPKFAHLREIRFGPKTEEEPKSNFVEQQKLEDQEPIIETPVLKMVEKQIKAEKEEEPVVEQKPAVKKQPVVKKQATVKKVTAHKKKPANKARRASSRKTTSKK